MLKHYHNIPSELRELDQWVCYDIEEKDGKERKTPYVPGTGDYARVNDKTTFRSFEEAVADVEDGSRDHIGFVLMKENGLVFIDLDHTEDPEERGLNKLIYQSFHSYSQRSVSGEGVHIIVRGELEGRGLHTSHFGLFEHSRGILMTGRVIKGRTKIRRANRKALRSLQEKVRTSDGRGYDFDLEEKEWDAQPWAVRSLASKIYGDKFHALIDGRWEGLGYPSQSEADHALINMFCDISDSNPLVRFLFAESGLYREHKARLDPETGEYTVKGYLDYTIKQNRAKQQRRDEVRERAAEAVADKVVEIENKKTKKKQSTNVVTWDESVSNASDDVIVNGKSRKSFDYPTDLIEKIPSLLHRDLALFIYKNSYRPNQEVSILCSHIVVTMIAQRAYLTPSGSGCNMNYWLIAETGWGKDIITKCVDLVAGELMKEYPAFGNSHVGKFASGEAIETVISQQPKFMSMVTEAGAFWRKLLSQHRPPHIDVLVESILKLFMSTNPNTYWKSRRRAKRDEDTAESVYRPAGSFYGESTPEDLLGDLDISSINTGLLQRQIFFHIASAVYVKANKKRFPMSARLRGMLCDLISAADNLDLMEDTVEVQCSERADLLLDHYSEGHSKYAYKENRNSLKANLFNRSGLKAYRIASLLAVGEDPHNPVIREAQARYAIDFVHSCDNFIFNKFQSGDIGRGQLKQESEMLALIENLLTAPPSVRRKSYRMNEFCADDPSIIPYSLVRNKAKTKTSFITDRFGSITAIDKCIESLCRSGTLVRLTRDESETEYGTSAVLLRYSSS